MTIRTSIIEPIITQIVEPIVHAGGVVSNWILRTGSWDDTGIWIDEDVWEDS